MLPFRNEIISRNLFSVSSLPSHPLPSPRETHLWYLLPEEVKSTSLMDQYSKILSPCESQDVLRRNGAELQKSALLARTLVRTTLSRYCNVTPAALSFGKNGYGKPQLLRKHGDGLSLPCLHFNVSHSSSLVACCVAMNSQVGIDVEQRNRKLKHDVLSLARRFYSPDELQFLEGLSEQELRRQEFIKLWTMKEAYVKALGRGFSAAPFRKFAIRHEAEVGKPTSSNASKITIAAHCDHDILTTNWQFALVELSSHYGAICVERTSDNTGEESESFKLKIWKTVPFVDDECVLETDAPIGGFMQSGQWLNAPR